MSGPRLRCRHLDALRDVLDAASTDPCGLAVPWSLLAELRSLLQSDLVAFEGVDHDHARCYFSQVSGRTVQLFTTGTAFGGRVGTTPQLVMGIPDGHGRELRLLALRQRGHDFDDRDRFHLRLLLPHLEVAYRRGEALRALRSVTARQAMLMELVRDGYTNAQIAHRLELAEGTVRTHLNNIYARLCVQSRTEAVCKLYGIWGTTLGTDDRLT